MIEAMRYSRSSHQFEQAPLMEPIIGIEHLSNAFGGVRAVQDLSLQVRRGKLFAFLGVNGVRKSRVLSILGAPVPAACPTYLAGMGWLLNAARKQKL